MQVSQETGKMVWYFYPLKSFPQFVMIHTVKGFSVVNKKDVDVFLEFPCFLYDPANVGNLNSGSSAFSTTSLDIWKFSCRILSITLPAWEMRVIVWWFEYSLVLPFLGIRMVIDLFQSCDHCWVFQICWHIECNTLITSSFKILNNSAGIPLLLLALLTECFLRPTWLHTTECLALGK